MSLQTTSGRHKAVHTLERSLRLRRLTRVLAEIRRRLTVRPQPFKAGAAYAAELLRHTASERPVTLLHLGSASIGYYGPTYAAAAPRIKDEVRVARHLFPAHNGRLGVVIAINGSVRPVVVEVPTVGTLYCEPNELELVDRPAARTLTMEAVLDEAAAGSGRAW